MTDEPRIVSARTRAPTEEETALFAWFAEQRKDPSKALEAGARQIISLVTAMYGLVFGILTFADDPFAGLPGPAARAWDGVRRGAGLSDRPDRGSGGRASRRLPLRSGEQRSASGGTGEADAPQVLGAASGGLELRHCDGGIRGAVLDYSL
jgi:hypothetical protein